MKRGSALLMALWIILTLSVIVLSFAFEAKLQGGINLYVEGKNRVKRLIPAGRLIGEVVLLGYSDASIIKRSPDETEADIAEKLEEDRFYLEKRDLKHGSGCKIGPILLDEDDPDSAIVKVEIKPSGSKVDDGININTLYDKGDPNFVDRWRIILESCGIPNVEAKDEDGHTVNLQSYIIACWQDFRDDDEAIYTLGDTQAFKGSQGAEDSEYEDYFEKHRKEIAEEDRFKPSNGEIADLRELSRVMCFRKFPALLTGGPLLGEKDGDTKMKRSRKRDKDEIIISPGIMNARILGVKGDGKLNVNTCSVAQLMTVPGIYDPDELDEGDQSESRRIAEAIVACRTKPPEDYDVPQDEEHMEKGWGYGEFTDDWWSDLTKRVYDETGLDVPTEAKDKLKAQPATEGEIFEMKITASLMGMEYSASCECYVKDGEVRYVSWEEN